MELPDPTLKIIKETVNLQFSNAELLLFGSRTGTEHRAESDYDLLIILDTPLDNHHRLYYQALIRKALANQNILADIIIQSKAEIEIKKKLPGHIIRSAVQQGIRV